MRTHTISGGGNLKLHVRDFGPPDAPSIVLIHGFSQHHFTWFKQFESSLAKDFRLVAMDLRGHGQSEAPLDAESYSSGALWAEDVAAVISSLGLISPILVGSSYGGLVIGDYLRSYGDDQIGGINLVGATAGIGPAWIGSMIGADFVKYAPSSASDDQQVALRSIQELLHCCVAQPLSPDDTELAMGWTMLTPPYVRGHLINRDEDFLPHYSQVRKPMLVSYGAADRIVLPALAAAIHEACPFSQMSEYEQIGHLPFLEDPARFNQELAAFSRTAVQS